MGGELEFDLFHRWFNAIFLLSALLSTALFYSQARGRARQSGWVQTGCSGRALLGLGQGTLLCGLHGSAASGKGASGGQLVRALPAGACSCQKAIAKPVADGCLLSVLPPMPAAVQADAAGGQRPVTGLHHATPAGMNRRCPAAASAARAVAAGAELVRVLLVAGPAVPSSGISLEGFR